MNHKILLIAVGICGLATSSHASLVAWYQFDEEAGATLALNQLPGSTGAIGTNVTTRVAGISGHAYSFTGGATVNDIVDMGNASFFSSINTTGQLTFSAWVNTTDILGDRNTVVFAGSDTITNNYADLGVNALIGEATARNRPAGASPAQQTGIFSSGFVVNDGAWHNIVMTIDLSTSELILYVDGIPTNVQFMAASLFPAFNNFEVGRLGRAGTPVDGFLGLIDDVQIYDTALSETQVQFLFDNPGVAIPEPSALVLAGLGLGFLYFTSRRRRT